MHPEFQIHNKLVGKRVLENAEICNKIANERHGLKKHQQSGLLALKKHLIGNICRLIRMLGCYSVNDAIGCFNIINHTPTIITLMCFGLIYTPACTLFQVIQKALHHIKTFHGTSVPI